MALTVEEAIAQRRSIRKFKAEAPTEATVDLLLEAVRLAPSGSNSQPWRFKVVRDGETRSALSSLAQHQAFIAQAPVVLVACVDLEGYIEASLDTIKEMEAESSLSAEMVESMTRRTEALRRDSRDFLGARVAFNMGIALEHLALRALDFGLGTCWVRAFDEGGIRSLFGWGEGLFVVALMPLGYPAEQPPARRRKALADLLLP